MPPKPLTSEELYSCCDPDLFKFSTTDELPELTETIGQVRALNAIDFGLNLDSKGFIFMCWVKTERGSRRR